MSKTLKEVASTIPDDADAYGDDFSDEDGDEYAGEDNYDDDFEGDGGRRRAESILRKSAQSKHGREMSVNEAADEMLRGKPKNLFGLLYSTAIRTRTKREVYNHRRMNEMAKPNAASTGKVYFKNGKERKYASNEDCLHCTFMPRSMRRKKGEEENKNNESKGSSDIGFLARMEAKEHKRRAALEEKRKEKEKKDLDMVKKGPKGSTKQLQQFLTRLENSEKEKEQKKAKLRKKHTPSFRQPKREHFDPEELASKTVRIADRPSWS
eukprot:g1666.t1